MSFRRLFSFALGILLCASLELAGAQAVRPINFESAIEAAAALPRLHSMLVSRRGQLILEQYFHGGTRSRLANVKSVSKSVISALVGIAIERKLIPSVDSPIAPYFKDHLAGADARKQKITIEDLLTMRSGLESTSIRNYGAWVLSPNWVRFVLRRPMIGIPGGEMIYSTGNFHLLSAILTKATGQSTWAFAGEALAKPLGFALAQWPRDPQGIYFGGNEMLFTPRQMAAFGELYLRRGRTAGRQIVPETWVDTSWKPRTRSNWSDQFYGYGWWMRELAGQPAYFAWGYGGQFIFVVPNLDAVIVITSSVSPGAERRNHTRGVYDIVEGLILKPLAATSG